MSNLVEQLWRHPDGGKTAAIRLVTLRYTARCEIKRGPESAKPLPISPRLCSSDGQELPRTRPGGQRIPDIRTVALARSTSKV